jgi:hypothetical protein
MVSTTITKGKLVFTLKREFELKEGNRYYIRYMNGPTYWNGILRDKHRLQFMTPHCMILLNHIHYYYELVPFTPHIQKKMEERALQKILCKIIGDEHFVWY